MGSAARRIVKAVYFDHPIYRLSCRRYPSEVERSNIFRRTDMGHDPVVVTNGFIDRGLHGRLVVIGQSVTGDIYGRTLWAEVERPGRRSTEPQEGRRKEVLARVLLGMVTPSIAIKAHFNHAPGDSPPRKRGREAMNHLVSLLRHGNDRDSPYCSEVAGLASPLGIENSLLENEIRVIWIARDR